MSGRGSPLESGQVAPSASLYLVPSLKMWPTSMHGLNTSGPVTYRCGHLEAGSWHGPDSLSFCTQPYEPHIHTTGDMSGPNREPLGQCMASGGYWGIVKKADLKHAGTAEKWFWLWGEDGPGASAGVHIRLPVNVWEYTDEERIY